MNIPVLTYHKLGKVTALDAFPNTCVSAENFSLQMRLLAGLGWKAADPRAYAAYAAGAGPRPAGKVFLLTFDDGFASVLKEGLPVLKALDFRALVFMVAGAWGRTAFWDGDAPENPQRLLTREEAALLLKEGWLFGAHGATHTALTGLLPEQLKEETAGAKASLEKDLGVKIDTFAYPYGKWDPAAQAAAAEAGYTAAFATELGGDGPHALPRRIISGRNGAFKFLWRFRQAGRLARV
jgi:peptidoglycan/xylan/chitin deacetylase (PgdA/CDA1 family)